MKRLGRLLPRLEGYLHRVLRWAGDGWRLPWLCLGLAFVGTLTAAYPITSVVVPAVLMAPRRWGVVSLFAALGSSCGALGMMLIAHYLGWSQLYAWFPAMATDPSWLRVMGWTHEYGLLALFAVALLPLPQTPALLALATVPLAYPGAFAAILAGKVLKYLGFAWVASRFPGHVHGFLHRHGRAPTPTPPGGSTPGRP